MPPSIKGKNPVSKAIPQLINKIYALYISAAARRNETARLVYPYQCPARRPHSPALPLSASETPVALRHAFRRPPLIFCSPPFPARAQGRFSARMQRTVPCPYAKNGSLPVRKERSLPVHKGGSPPTPKGRRFPERPSLLLFKNS